MRDQKTFWRTVLIVSLVGCICFLGLVIWYLFQGIFGQKQYENLQEMVITEVTPEPTVTVMVTPQPTAVEITPEPTPVENQEQAYANGEAEGTEAALPDDIFLDMQNPIDFAKLQEINTDVYAWIRIEDTQIDYPIAQRAGDDSYYLHHDMYGQYRFAGCIYTEDCNSKDFTDPNTLIYGHNMKNGSMFKGLHNFADSTFFEEHPYIYIYTPEHVLVYKVFAAYTYDDRHIMNSFDFTDKEVFAQYLTDIFQVRSMDANIREDVTVTADDRIVTLETCIGADPDARYLVQAVLIKDGRNE